VYEEQQTRGNLQIAEELNNGLMKTKSRLLQQIFGTRYSSEQVDDSPGGRRILREFYVIKKILIGNLIDFIITYGL
jgi:hypothetical protein